MENNNNNYDETYDNMSPGKKALDHLSEDRHETPEEWIKKLDDSEQTFWENNKSSKDPRGDHIFNYFKKINPLGIPLADLKDELAGNIEHLKEAIKYTAIDESLVREKRDELIEDLQKRISEKENWITHIDEFIMNGDSEPFDDSQRTAEQKKVKIVGLINQQKNPDRN